MTSERFAEAHFSRDELHVLEEVLSATAARGGTALEQHRKAAALLQTEAGGSLCRQFMTLRRAVGVSSPERTAERAALRTDWPSGEWTEEIGALALAEHARSGLSETAFCEATGISRGRIRGWRRKLAR